jgi:beta-galactosidase/beta-glucuronidase
MPSHDAHPVSGRGYPRPQLRRADWVSLDGPWEFALDPDAAWSHPGQVAFDRTIRVPFSPETPASGIGDTGLYRACWYRRRVTRPPLAAGERLHLHFGAVDYRATVWINGYPACTHEGGYTPFTVDLTQFVGLPNELELVVQVDDDPLDLCKPRGKQDWQRHPHSIWYPRTTGIWQSVWMERLPPSWFQRIKWTPNLERWEIGCAVWLSGVTDDTHRLDVELTVGPTAIAHDVYGVSSGEVHRRIALSDPGIDDSRNVLLWNPDRPTVIDARLTLTTRDGTILDQVHSYTALRNVTVDGDRFILNGRPYPLRLVLDQGYWPESGLTAPDDAAFARDVRLVKAMGFNGVRKHQKIEDPRFLYWADHMGLLVWEEMPSAYRFTQMSVERLTSEWMAVIARDISHPCIIAWVPFNESWGVPNLPLVPSERHWVRTLYELTKTLDPTRPVIGNDGWESVATDIIGIHDYDADPDQLTRRYQTSDVLPTVFKRERPGGRTLVLEGQRAIEQPIMLTEFGGIALAREHAENWGYSRAASAAGLAERYRALMRAVNRLASICGFCYTQFTDTYQEANGLLYADRTPKVPLPVLAAATRGLADDRALVEEIQGVQADADQA